MLETHEVSTNIGSDDNESFSLIYNFLLSQEE